MPLKIVFSKGNEINSVQGTKISELNVNFGVTILPFSVVFVNWMLFTIICRSESRAFELNEIIIREVLLT